MTMFNHNCIKPGCGNKYQDDDPDAYYCKNCDAINKATAKEVDAKLAARPSRETKSSLQQYDEAQKVHGFLHVKL